MMFDVVECEKGKESRQALSSVWCVQKRSPQAEVGQYQLPVELPCLWWCFGGGGVVSAAVLVSGRVEEDRFFFVDSRPACYSMSLSLKIFRAD